jgi:flagellar biosynthesis protein FliQ
VDQLLEHLNKGMVLSLLLSFPSVLLAAGIGLIVGILQAVTQVQEQTIAAAPKILGVFLLLIITSGLMLGAITDYIRESVVLAMDEIPQEGPFILPKDSTPAKITLAGQPNDSERLNRAPLADHKISKLKAQ